MSRNLRARVERLERQNGVTSSGNLPPLFWQALCGTVPLDQLDPQTRRLVEALFTDGRPALDPVEEKIRQALQSRLSETTDGTLSNGRAEAGEIVLEDRAIAHGPSPMPEERDQNASFVTRADKSATFVPKELEVR